MEYNFYGETVVSTLRRLDKIFGTDMTDFDVMTDFEDMPDYSRDVTNESEGIYGYLWLKDGRVHDDDEEMEFSIHAENEAESRKVKEYVEQRLAKDVFKHPVYAVFSGYSGNEAPVLTGGFSYARAQGEELIGYYSNLEAAMKTAQDEWEKKGNWLCRLPIPYGVYRTYINDFKKDRYDRPLIRAYKGYTKKQWEDTHTEVDTAKRLYQSYEYTKVEKHEIEDLPSSITAIWHEAEFEVVKKLVKRETKLLPFEGGGKWGFKDEATGKVVTKPRYDDIQPVSREVKVSPDYLDREYIPPADKVWMVKLNGKTGVVDEYGFEIVKPEYDDITVMEIPFNEKLYYWFKALKDGLYGLFNNHGLVTLPVIYGSLVRQNHWADKLNVQARKNDTWEDFEIDIDYEIFDNNRRHQKLRQQRAENEKQANIDFDSRKATMNEQFVWTDEAKSALLRLNAALLKAQESVMNTNERIWKYRNVEWEVNRHGLNAKLDLAIGEQEDEWHFERFYEGLYGELNSYISADGVINRTDMTRWKTYTPAELPILIGREAAQHFTEADAAEYSFGLHAIWDYTPLAWEDILKINYISLEMRVEAVKEEELLK